MHDRSLHRPKRYLTEPDQPSHEHRSIFGKLELQIESLHYLNQINVPQALNLPNAAIAKSHVPLHSKANPKGNVLRRLPVLAQNNLAEQQQKRRPVFKRSNPLFVVNTLFQIMKDDFTPQKGVAKQELPKKANQNQGANEFWDFGAQSVKIHRAPRLVDNKMNRLTHQSNFGRRKIYSQEKARIKCEVELMTFYKPKQQSNDGNEFVR